MIEHQWSAAQPKQFMRDLIKLLWYIKNGKKKNTIAIESFFSNQLDSDVTLTTSGRNAIHQILHHNRINREKTVFITKFSSYCLYQSIGSLANVSTDYETPDVEIINHKWGKTNLSTNRKNHPALTIEDSCDSLIENNKDLFPNLGDYEIISLSKIMNSISGGIILHNKNAIKINNQKSNTRFNFTSEMKFGRKLIRAFFPRYNWKPLCFEHLNHALSHVEVAHIRTCLKNYHRNLQLIRHRLITIENLCGDKFNRFSNRIGPGVVVEFHENKIDAVESSLPPKSLIRHFDTSLSNDKDASYKKIVYLPLHANIDHETFEKFEDFINRNLFQIGSVY